ncbi:MAG: DUF554 domain-containing protein [Clostridium sulfidigenes]|uniref:DUF554 domain-containing protein n=1 Tax=Clostridium sulfidigenes TaxID=318464 RepID=A0A927W601_9CLOT|nr:DUF554 domain-containing protein [Clostridium sulfidigenes]
MLGTIVNTVAVIIGGAIGILLKRGLPEKISDTVMKGLALSTLYIGISGVLKGKNTIILIISIVLGAIIGEAVDLDDKLNSFGNFIERKFKSKDKNTSIAEGLVTASLLFCVGAMAVVGSLQSGLTGNNEILFTKSILDFVAAIIFASSLGVGVIFSSIFIFIYQGTLTLLAQFISPYLGEVVVAEMTCVGSLLIIALALNMMKVSKFKVMNYVPAIFLPVIIYLFI